MKNVFRYHTIADIRHILYYSTCREKRQIAQTFLYISYAFLIRFCTLETEIFDKIVLTLWDFTARVPAKFQSDTIIWTAAVVASRLREIKDVGTSDNKIIHIAYLLPPNLYDRPNQTQRL